GGESSERRVAAELQRAATALGVGRPDAGGVCRALARSARRTRCARQREHSGTMNPISHCTWIEEWGLVTVCLRRLRLHDYDRDAEGTQLSPMHEAQGALHPALRA